VQIKIKAKSEFKNILITLKENEKLHKKIKVLFSTKPKTLVRRMGKTIFLELLKKFF